MHKEGQNIPAYMMANMIVNKDGQKLDDASQIKGVKPGEKRLLQQELTNLDYKEIDIIENLYNEHFINKSDPDYEQKKAKGISHNTTTKNSAEHQVEQDLQAGDSSTHTKSAKSRQIMKNTQICKSLEQFEKMQQ